MTMTDPSARLEEFNARLRSAAILRSGNRADLIERATKMGFTAKSVARGISLIPYSFAMAFFRQETPRLQRVHMSIDGQHRLCIWRECEVEIEMTLRRLVSPRRVRVYMGVADIDGSAATNGFGVVLEFPDGSRHPFMLAKVWRRDWT